MTIQQTMQTGQTQQTGQTMSNANVKVDVSSPFALAVTPSKRWLSMGMALMLTVSFGMVAGCDNSDNKRASQEAEPSATVVGEPITDAPATTPADATDAGANSGDSNSNNNSNSNSNSPNDAADSDPIAADSAAKATITNETTVEATAGAQVPLSAAAGKDLYAQQCHMCHDDGLLDAPKLGDKAAWAPRIAKGIDVLHQHSAQGYEKMPAQATDEVTATQVYAAVDYIVAQSS